MKICSDFHAEGGFGIASGVTAGEGYALVDGTRGVRDEIVFIDVTHVLFRAEGG